MAIIRDRVTGRIVGVVKQRPLWASEDELRHIILMPALRYLNAAIQYFREGRSSVAIAREMGVSTHAVRMFLCRIRKAAGAPNERLKEAKLDHLSKETMAMVKQADLKLTSRGIRKRSKGRYWEDAWANNDTLLRETILGPSLRHYEIARRYWLQGHTAQQIADALGMTLKEVESVLVRVRRRARNPQLEPRVLLSKTRKGRTRRGRLIV